MDSDAYNYKVIKVFNNNIVLISQNNKEKILFEKGIGFGKHLGDIISKTSKIEKIFSMEDKTNSNNFNELINTLDKSVVALCEEVIYMISKELNEELNEKVHISLTDHIAFSLKRLKNGETIKNPFLIEIETLYPREFELAKKAVTMIENKTKVHFPDDEVGFITLHIHSARNEGKLSNTVKYAFLSNSIINLIEDELNIDVDKKSLDYARFITHIRFAIQRIINGTPIENDLLDIIKKQYYLAFKLSEKVSRLLENELGLKVVEAETAYLAIHIKRFEILSRK